MIGIPMGWAVERTFPVDVVAGLYTGRYRLFGGVVRWAAGTEHAGQIVRHLIPVASGLGSLMWGNPLPLLAAVGDIFFKFKSISQLNRVERKLDHLTVMTQQMLHLATGTMALSGLNLAVSAVGFVVLGSKVNALDGKLDAIQADVKEIKHILQRAERARLRHAMSNLAHVSGSKDVVNRHTMLHDARKSLGELNQSYRELFAGAETVDAALACEEYFTLTALALTRCTAELGMVDVARKELAEADRFWKETSRKLAKERLIGDDPERFLASDFAKELPAVVVADWLDFASDEEKGYIWVDELRAKSRPWYNSGLLPDVKFGRGGLDYQQATVIPALQKLVSRNAVYDGYIAQYEMMEKAGLRPSQMEAALNEVDPELLTEGYLLLRPVAAGGSRRSGESR